MPERFDDDEAVMRRALELAAGGIGRVEPNPPVGAVIVDDDLRWLGEGHHERFGGPHAEINALTQAGDASRGATLFVTLEPCCHQGQTGPCSRALIEAGIRRVVVAVRDAAPHVDGGGIAELKAAGIEVEVGLLEREARRLVAPFFKLMTTGRPWVHAKWAMTLDGRIASRTGHSRWISNESSRRVVHALRGRMDAVAVGAGTVAADDPLLTARPAGPRIATRIVCDTAARLPLGSQLVRSIDAAPVLLAAGETAPTDRVGALRDAGVDVLRLPVTAGADGTARIALPALLDELGRRRMTHVLVEGGGALLGGFFDAGLIDEVHAFVAAKLVGGDSSPGPVGGRGLDAIPEIGQLDEPEIELLDGDVYLHGPWRRSANPNAD